MEISGSHIRKWLQSHSAEVRAEGADDDLLLRLAEHLKIRSKNYAQLRAVLCEMAARGQVVLQFADSQMETAAIVAISLVTESPAVQIERLKKQLDDLHVANAELQVNLDAAAADVVAADELATEALAAQAAAESAAEELRVQVAQLQARPQKQPEPQRRSTTITSRQLASARTRAQAGEARVAELLATLAEVRRKLRVGVRGFEFYDMSCGCQIARGDTTKCRAGGREHPFFAIALPGISHERATALVSQLFAHVAHVMGDSKAVVVTNDLVGRPMP